MTPQPSFDTLDVLVFIAGLGVLALAFALLCVAWDRRSRKDANGKNKLP
jgi:hypothetical protein